MNSIYLYEGEILKGEKGYPLINIGARAYMKEVRCELCDDLIVEKNSKGKPFFKNSDIKFSLSHSRHMWMCLYSDKNCGIDVQYYEPKDYEKIARRFFKYSEIAYVKDKGEEGFYRLWTYKESFAKCTGDGIFSDMPLFVDENGELCSKVLWKNKVYSFQDIIMDDGIACAVCVETKSILDKIEVRNI